MGGSTQCPRDRIASCRSAWFEPFVAGVGPSMTDASRRETFAIQFRHQMCGNRILCEATLDMARRSESQVRCFGVFQPEMMRFSGHPNVEQPALGCPAPESGASGPRMLQLECSCGLVLFINFPVISLSVCANRRRHDCKALPVLDGAFGLRVVRFWARGLALSVLLYCYWWLRPALLSTAADYSARRRLPHYNYVGSTK